MGMGGYDQGYDGMNQSFGFNNNNMNMSMGMDINNLHLNGRCNIVRVLFSMSIYICISFQRNVVTNVCQHGVSFLQRCIKFAFLDFADVEVGMVSSKCIPPDMSDVVEDSSPSFLS